MKSSGLRGRPRPTLCDAERALESVAEYRSYPSSWESSLTEEASSQRFVRLRSGNLVLWVYLGSAEDHILVPVRPRIPGTVKELPVYCSCEGFQRRLASDEEFGCTHSLALMRLSRGSPGFYRSEELPPEVLVKVVDEILTLGQSVTLRVALYSRERRKGLSEL
jgi:predicted nucleic acid-binding Zn finger protein